MGRPTKYTRALGTRICERLAEGESLRAICKEAGYPAISNICAWLVSDAPLFKAFQEQYAKARKAQREIIEDEILDIADDGSNDWMERETKKGTITVINWEHVQRSKLRIEARQWKIGRMDSKRQEGPDDRAPQKIELVVDPKPERPK